MTTREEQCPKQDIITLHMYIAIKIGVYKPMSKVLCEAIRLRSQILIQLLKPQIFTISTSFRLFSVYKCNNCKSKLY